MIRQSKGLLTHFDHTASTHILSLLMTKPDMMPPDQFIIQYPQDPNLPSKELPTNTIMTSLINLSNLFTQQAQIVSMNYVYHLPVTKEEKMKINCMKYIKV